jgi:uncharacterized protein (TIRG00374 family)
MNKKIKVFLGWSITLFFLHLTLGKMDFNQVLTQVHSVKLNWIFLAIIVLACDYAVRVFRWQFMFRSTEFNPPLWLCGRFFLIGNALNNILPMRAGDLYRIVRFSEKSNIPSGTVLATVAVERVFDISALLVLLYLGISGETGRLIFGNFPPEIQQTVKLFTAACFVGALALLFIPLQIKKLLKIFNGYISIPKKILTFLYDTLDAIQGLLSPRKALCLITFSLVAWFLESLAYGSVQASLSLELPINAMLISNAFATISTLFPSSPGYVGTFHYFAALSLAPFEVNSSIAATFALIMHALLWICVSSFGLLAYFTTLNFLYNLNNK